MKAEFELKAEYFEYLCVLAIYALYVCLSHLSTVILLVLTHFKSFLSKSIFQI